MKVAIVGGADSAFEAPFDDPEWDIWVLGNQLDKFKGKRVTRIFEIHDDLSEHDPRYEEWLVSLGIPLVVGDEFFIEHTHVTRFPKEADVLGKLSSSPAYMMALAIHEGYRDISIFGIDMAIDNHEYFMQRAGMYAWIGYAKGLGINVTVAESSCLFKDNYDEGKDWGKGQDTPFTENQFLELVKMHEQKKLEYQNQLESINAQIHGHEGAISAYKRLAKISRAIKSGIDVKSITEVNIL